MWYHISLIRHTGPRRRQVANRVKPVITTMAKSSTVQWQTKSEMLSLRLAKASISGDSENPKGICHDICTDIFTDIVCYIIFLPVQDCVCLIAPYPNNPNPPETFNIATDFDMSGDGLLWNGWQQLLFRCTLCPAGAFQINDTQHHTEVTLAFFSKSAHAHRLHLFQVSLDWTYDSFFEQPSLGDCDMVG